MTESCGVIVLAGGHSSRMGQPKAWLEFAGWPLLAHLVERLGARFPEVVVVGAPGQELPETPAPVVRDEVPGQGPVGGLVVGLRAVQSPLAFVCSCDVPFLNPALAAYLAGRAEGYDVVLPEWQGRAHPLLAVYRTNVQPLYAERLAAGQRKVMGIYDRLRVLTVRDDELRVADPDGESFFNMNAPEDYQEALQRWKA